VQGPEFKPQYYQWKEKTQLEMGNYKPLRNALETKMDDIWP
jgi:hypothetical protein